MPDLLFFDAIGPEHAALVGGKGASLAALARAGLPVPDGFVVTANAHRRYARSPDLDPDFANAVKAAYARFGGLVAVRSSATAEDATDTSFAGQQDTFLGIEGGPQVLDAVQRCWRSLHTERAAAYRAKQGVDEAALAMAVVVQRLVPAEAAGVLFTRDPLDANGSRMLVEASWGLGEAVVSGRVAPDRFHIDRDTGRVLERHLGRKAVRITAAGEEHVTAADQQAFCLGDSSLSQLAELGRNVEAHYGDARDIEWAWAEGRAFLLQARPITAASAAEREAVRRSLIDELAAAAEPGGTVWVRYNLSEVLPAPTPMTWAVVQRLLAADGGCGTMNRDLGYTPDPALGSRTAFDLVAGRPMANLSRLPRMQFANPPIEYPFAALKADPRKALNPVPVLNPLRGGILRGLLRLPATVWRLSRAMNSTRRRLATYAEEFSQTLMPPFVSAARTGLQQDWSKFDAKGLVFEFELWCDATLVNFAKDSLKATVFADYSWSALTELLKPKLGAERAAAAVAELTVGAHPPPEADLAAAIRSLSAGNLSREEFLQSFGHRGTNEMELAQPRWSEKPEELERLVSKTGHGPPSVGLDPNAIADEAKLAGPARDQFRILVQNVRTFLGLREAAKNALLLGYAVIRRALVELDRRCWLNGGIFYLTPTDFPALLDGVDLTSQIAAARKRRQAALSLPVPPVLYSDALEAIGTPPPEPDVGAKLGGVPLSAGVVEGPALVLAEPTAAPPNEGYILVCPTTDPAWVPLFVNAAGLVMETGGVLSHGAIVAREFGLPAVAGLPGITERLTTGQRLRVDGARGTVTVLE